MYLFTIQCSVMYISCFCTIHASSILDIWSSRTHKNTLCPYLHDCIYLHCIYVCKYVSMHLYVNIASFALLHTFAYFSTDEITFLQLFVLIIPFITYSRWLNMDLKFKTSVSKQLVQGRYMESTQQTHIIMQLLDYT